MGWLSKLGKGLLFGGAALAAPFTGGASLAGALGLSGAVGAGATTIGGMLSALGSNAGAAGAGMGSAAAAAAANRGAEAGLRFDVKDQLERQLLAREAEKRAVQGEFRLQEGERRAGIGETRTAESDAYRKAIGSAGLLNWKPMTRPSNIPNFNPKGFGVSDRMKAVARKLYGRSSGRLNRLPNDVFIPGTAPEYNPGLPDYTPLMDDPDFTNLLKPGNWEKAGGIGSFLVPIGSSMIDYFTNRDRQSTEVDPTELPGVPSWRDWEAIGR